MIAPAVVLLAAALAAAPAAPPREVRRVALLVGTNDGGPERVRLRYAASDAEALGRVLDELGGVAPQDEVLLLEVNRKGFYEGLEKLRTLLGEAKLSGRRTEALVYYSGHSDEEGLLLRGDRVSYGELRQALAELPADVRIAILDSCASGTLARRKGGVKRPAFLVDASSTVQGQAILTSSSADEVSQESDRVGGSFFTHNLVSGLRGAADVTGDGRVTLHEAYQFAFHETLARTEKTQAGAQHPAYDMELAGAGDLVMTDVRSTSAGLVLSDSLEGRLFIRDAEGRLAVELNKLPGRPMELGLAPGAYTVARELGGRSSRAALQLREGGRTALRTEDFGAVTGELTVSRGDVPKEVTADVPGEAPRHRAQAFNIGFVPGLQTNSLFEGPVDNRVSLSLGVATNARLDGLALALGANWTAADAHGVQASIGGNHTGTDLNGAQFSVGFNHVGGDVHGVQGTVGVNHAGGNVGLGQVAVGGNSAGGGLEGFQLSVGYNAVAGSTLGLQTAVGGNVTRGSLRGVQLGVGANVVGTAVEGLQLGVGANVAGSDLQGVQVAAGANVVGRRLDGLQLSSGFNRAADLHGVQVGLINVGGDVSGSQVGLINVATRASGLQLGLVNVAGTMKGAPVGILNFMGNGQLHGELYGSDITQLNLDVKLGSEHVYTVFTGGLGEKRGGQDEFASLGIGLGVHLVATERLFVDVDALASSIYVDRKWDSHWLLAQLRVKAGYQIARRFAVIGGPTLNVQTAFDDHEPLPFGKLVITEGHQVRITPGLQLGVRI
ncbi:caspase family protein [Aggregicoccus sp. 17bor-14]|uniref:caspase family protein n=1 Tax=Myxococcaceae TaxID=31 RepID=UPI00129CD76B|nr:MULTISPECIES: caspase family protein [Myxococcaceae]MBF5045188.1 caspase family protein [Simulacricoccus sp. 17bor-14]MRI90929.1 caspase family protein [Aggregicoccus sp. 17bor-14]